MKRFAPLDIYRGMTICLMIIVNSTGDWGQTFAPLLHAPWHGFTPTDWVFPSFLFAMGTSFAFVKTRWANTTLREVLPKIVKRTLIIFLLGYLLNCFPFVRWSPEGELVRKAFADIRIMGVLQRIALCYLLAALLIFCFKQKRLMLVSGVLLIAYWIVLYAFGDYSLEGNVARAIDRLLLGDAHLYKGEGLPFDPEGLLSTLPAAVNVIGGYFTGSYLLRDKITYEHLAKLLMLGSVLMALAYCWHLSFPINKKIWTSSYVLLTIGISMIVLTLIIYLMEFKTKPLSFYFFDIFGKNSLVIYLFSIFLAILLLVFRTPHQQNFYSWIYVNGFKWIGPYYGAFAFAFSFMLACWLFGWFLYRRKIFIRV
ncbi:MAG: DUF5009 domain-containing protein [Bacteroidota bacterium]